MYYGVYIFMLLKLYAYSENNIMPNAVFQKYNVPIVP